MNDNFSSVCLLSPKCYLPLELATVAYFHKMVMCRRIAAEKSMNSASTNLKRSDLISPQNLVLIKLPTGQMLLYIVLRVRLGLVDEYLHWQRVGNMSVSPVPVNDAYMPCVTGSD